MNIEPGRSELCLSGEHFFLANIGVAKVGLFYIFLI